MTAETPSRATHATPRPGDWRVEVWRTFLRSHARMMAELERDLGEHAGLSLAWYDVLLQLVEAPERRLRMADLAERVLLSRSGLTRLVDRLQAEGLVRREPSPDDARGTYTILTDAGFRRLRDAAPTHLGGVQRHWLGHFSDEELRTLGELLGRIDGGNPDDNPDDDPDGCDAAAGDPDGVGPAGGAAPVDEQ